MAIRGMMELEDISICWDTQGVPGGQVFVRVSECTADGPDSEARTTAATLDLAQFMNVLTLAISANGKGTNGMAWDDAEQVAQALGGIRICP